MILFISCLSFPTLYGAWNFFWVILYFLSKVILLLFTEIKISGTNCLGVSVIFDEVLLNHRLT